MADRPERSRYNDVTQWQRVGSGAGERGAGGVSAPRAGMPSQWKHGGGACTAGGEAVRPGLRHSTPSDGDEVSKAVDQPIVSVVCTADPEVFPQGGQVTHTQPLRRPSVEIIAAFTSVTPPPATTDCYNRCKSTTCLSI